MIKRTLKRTLSVFLTLVLLATTFFIFDPSVLKTDANAWVDVEENTMGTSLAAQMANAPETIYTRPGSNQFDFYSNLNVNTRAPGESTSNQGTVSFQNGKATEVKLFVNNFWKKTAQNTYNEATIGTTLKLGSTNSSAFFGNPVAAKINATSAGGASSSIPGSASILVAGTSSVSYTFNNTQCQLNANDGEVYIIEWGVEYKIGSNYHYTFMYTGLYKPERNLTGVSAYTKHTGGGNTPEVGGFLFITGAMAYAAVGNRSCAYIQPTAGVNAHPLIKFVGYQNNSSSYSIGNVSSQYDTAAFPTTGSKTVLAVKDTYDGENGCFTTSYTDMGTYVSHSSLQGASNSSDIKWDGSAMAEHVGVAYMVIDNSRFSNYSQVPYLSAGFVRFYHKRGGARAQIRYMRCQDTTDRSGSSNGITVSIDTSNHDDGEESWQSRTYGLSSFNGAVATGDKKMYLMMKYTENRTGIYDGESNQPANLYLGVGLSVTGVNKGNIRTAYCAGLTSNIDKITYASYSTYYSNMMTQARLLCDPTATNSTVSVAAATIDSAQDEIVTANTVSVLYFYVPETIYLNPKDSDTFQYYVDRANADNGALRTDGGSADITKNNSTDGSKTGNVYLHVPGATSVSISSSGGSVTLGASSGTETISTTMTGSWGSAMAEGSTGTITWTATYVIDGQTYTAKNYTTVYSPLCTTSSTVAQQVGSYSGGGSNAKLTATGWITGVHSIEVNSDTTNRTAASGYDLAGSMIDPPLTDYSVTCGNDAYGMDENKNEKWLKATTPGTGYSGWYCWSGNSDRNENTKYSYYNGVLTVDYSRYTNFNQIPQLVGGVDVGNEKGQKHKDHVCFKHIGVTNSTTLNTTNLKNVDECPAGGDRQAYKLNTAVNSGVKFICLGFDYKLVGESQRNTTRHARTIGYIYVRVNPVTKAALREEIDKQISTGKYSAWYTSGTWSTYESALQTAITTLGTLNKTQTQVDNAKNALANAAASLVKATGTLTGTHVGSNGVSLGTDNSKSYNYGDTLLGGPNEYVGYEYSAFIGSDFYACSASKTGVNVSSVSWDSNLDRLTFTSSSGTDNYTTMPSASTAVAGLYFIPIEPGQPFKLTYTSTGTSSQAFIFQLNSEKKWITSVAYPASYNTGAVTIQGTASENTYYLSLRFGNKTANSTTVFKDIILTVGTRTVRNCYDSSYNMTFKYVPKKYDVKYDPNGGTFNGKTEIYTYEDAAKYDDPFNVGATTLGGSAQNPPTKTGYDFQGWSFNGTTYTNGQQISEWKFDMENVTFVAQWQAKSYIVKYNSNPPSNSEPTLSTPYYGTDATASTFSYDESISIPDQNGSYAKIGRRTGYNLTGWSTLASGGTAVAFSSNCEVRNLVNAQSSNTGTIYLYAVWSAIDYTLTVHPITETTSGSYPTTDDTTGGTVSGGGSGKHYGDAISVSATAKTGFTFDGWYSDSGLTTSVTPATTMPASNTSYWAKFSREKYTVTFKKNDGTSNNHTTWTNVRYGSSQTLTEPSRTGYTFGGWYDNTAGTGTQIYTTGTNVVKLHGTGTGRVATTLYAKWTPHVITVKYSGGTGAVGSMTDDTFNYGSNYTTKTNTFTNSRVVNFNANGGSVGVSSLTSTGAFVKWQSSGTGASSSGYNQNTAYSDSLGVGNASTVTLTAQWSFPVITLPEPDHITGQQFDGWYTDATDGTRVGGAGDTYPPTQSTITLYAHYSEADYQLSCYPYYNTTVGGKVYSSGTNGGTVTITGHGSDTVATYNYEDSYTIVATPQTGYKFGGWYTEQPVYNNTTNETVWNESARVSTSSSFTATMPDGNISYYAKFTLKYCTVKAYAYSNTAANTGTWTTPPSVNVTVNVSAGTTGGAGASSTGLLGESGTATLIANANSSTTGYHFVGWYDAAPTGGTTWGTRASTSTSYTINFTSDGATITKYARFDITRNTLSINPDGGSYTITENATGTAYNSTQSFTRNGGTVITISGLTKTGYHSNGWEKVSSGNLSGTMATVSANETYNYTYASGDTYDTTDSIKLKWSPNTYTIIFNGNGADGGSMSPLPMEYDEQKNLTANAFTKTGYDFDGWAKDDPSNAVSYEDGDPVSNLTSSDGAEVNLYAKWVIKTYTVYADAYSNTAAATGTFANNTTGGTVQIESGTAGASVSESGVAHGSSVTLTANPGTGYSFAGWYDSTNGSQPNFSNEASSAVNPRTVTIESNVNYFAKFTINSYTINVGKYANTAAATDTFTSGTGGTIKINNIVTTSATAYYGQTVTLYAKPSSGYTFAGWYINKTPSSSVDPDIAANTTTTDYNYTITVGSNDTYNARFDLKPIKVYVYAYSNGSGTYANNTTGGKVKVKGVIPEVAETVADKSKSLSILYTGTFTITATAETGYTFDGWYTTYDSTNITFSNKVTSETTYTATKTTSTQKFYALFNIKQYSLTVYAYSNAGSGGSTASYANNRTGGTVAIGSGTPAESASAYFNYNSTPTMVATPATGYEFGGWYSSVTGGSGNPVTAWNTMRGTVNDLSIASAALTKTRKYYAKFTAKGFTIEFNNNGGSQNGAVTSITAYYDSTASLVNTSPSKLGAQFLGWSTDSTATTATYEPNATLTAGEVNALFTGRADELAPATLYAVWSDYTYTEYVLAACNTGDNPDTYTISDVGGTASFASGVTKIIPGDDITAKISRSPNTGYQYKEIRYAQTASVPASGDVVSPSFGYGTSSSHNMEDDVDFHNDVTVVFIVFFEVEKYDIKLYAESENATSASAANAFSNNTAGGSVKISLNGVDGAAGAEALADNIYYGTTTTQFKATAKPGYEFVGWYSDAAMTTDSRVSTSSNYNLTLTSNITYYAKFVLESYKAYGYAEYYTDGYDEATEKGTLGTNGGTVTVTASLPSGSYGYTAYASGTSTTTASVNPASVDAKFNQTVSYSASPATGYTFVGWYYSEGATYSEGYEGDIQLDSAIEILDSYTVEMADSNIYIHAKFVPCNFILAFNANPGVGNIAVLGPTAAVTLTYNKGTTLDSTSIPACSGKTFRGWAESAEAAEPYYTYSNGSCTISSAVINTWFNQVGEGNQKELYAIWQVATYTVTLDFDGGNDNANAQTSVEDISQGNDMPAIQSAKLPENEGYQFAGYYTEPGGTGKQYYNANGTSASVWDQPDDITLYAKWICPVLVNATYDDETGKWTYEYESTSGGTVSCESDDEIFDAQTITDNGLDVENAKEITSRDRTETDGIINKNKETANINLNHFSKESLSSLLTSVTATNTDQLRSALSQPELNVYVSKTSYYLDHTITSNQRSEDDIKPSINIYESESKLNSVKQKTITDPSSSASGVTYEYPRSTDASSYVYTNKWSEVEGGSVDYFIYTNSIAPVIAIEIDDGEVLTSSAFSNGGSTPSSYPTNADVSAKDSSGNIDADSVSEFSAVAATNNISEAWFAPYVNAGIGVGTSATKAAHDYNAKTVLYLTPDFSSDTASGTVNEVIYTITPNDDAYRGEDSKGDIINNCGFETSGIADVPNGLEDRFSSLNTACEDGTSIKVCVSYHNSMDGTSDEGGEEGETYFKVYTDQLQDGKSYFDTWLNQMHLFRISGGADNWELPMTGEDVYPVDDITYRNNNGYVLGSFAYVFDANTEPAAAERAFNEDYTAAKEIIINSIKSNMADTYENISNHSFSVYNAADDNSGLGMFQIKNWSTNYYPRPDSYVYVHLIDRWGNVFNKVWKNFKIDAAKPKITGTVSTSFTVNEAGGSNLASFTLNDTDVTFITDIDSTYENKVYTTSGNSFVISTDKPATKLQLAVTDNAGNVLSGKIPTDKQGLIRFNVTDECADLSSGAYTFTFNDNEVNLWAREPALVRSADMSASAICGEPCTIKIKTMDTAIKVQLIENGATRTYTPDMSNVTVVDNGDGTLSWTIKLNSLSMGDHTFQIKCKDKSGEWNDCDFTLSTTVSEKPVVNESVISKLSNATCEIGERAVLEVTTAEGTQAVRVFFENGYAKTVLRSDDVVVSCVDGIEVWRFTAGAFSEAGEYTASAYVKYNDIWHKTDVATSKITVKEPVEPQAVIIAATIINKEINAGDKATIEVLTNGVTDKLQFVLPDGTTSTVTTDNATVKENGDSTLTWTISKSFATIGSNEIVLKARSKSGWTDAKSYGTVTVK